MSRETFEKRINEYGINPHSTAAELIALIEESGGRVYFPLPTPEGAGCTCETWDFDPDAAPKDVPGPHHYTTCVLHKPL